MKKYTVIFSSLFLLVACREPAAKTTAPDPEKTAANYRLISSLKPQIQNGDMIFRNGMDAVSRAARSFNRKDTSFSHCGILMIEHDSVFVYHALGGAYNPSQQLMRQPLDSFCNPAENNAIGVYRFPLSAAENEKLQETVRAYYRAGLRFDLFFNFQTDDKMYCSEFVFKSLNRAVNNSLSSYVRMDTIPFGVTTDDLFLHPKSRLISRQNFIY